MHSVGSILIDLLPDPKKSYSFGTPKFTTIYLPKDSPWIESFRKDGLTVIVYDTKIIEVLKPFD